MATLAARTREGTGKGNARKLRRDGGVPAVAYGHGQKTRSLQVDARELTLLLSSINPENTIIELAVEGTKRPVPALIREIQHHPSKPVILHVDFFQIRAGEKIHVEVPIRLNGAPVGVREAGGILQETLRELSVECLPKDIPNSVEVDVEDLELGGSVHVSDLNVPNVTILNDPDLVVCSVTAPTVVELPEGPEAEEGVGEVDTELVGDSSADAESVSAEEGSSSSD